jgi:CDGSH-type Zn-finger protein
MKITVSKNGPYLVSGNVPLMLGAITHDEQGNPTGYTRIKTFSPPPIYALCRCGLSKNKPFCDGAHVAGAFQGTTTATHEPYASQAKQTAGDGITLFDDFALCIDAAFCDVGDKVWNYTKESADPASKSMAIEQAKLCPSGRLVMHDGEGAPIEPSFEPSIMILQDPSQNCSAAIWVRGGIEIFDEDSKPYEIRNRQTLCRCGKSANKPFCDGKHYSAAFNDGEAMA